MSIIKSGTTTTTAYSVDANTDGDLVFIVSESLTAMSITAAGAVSLPTSSLTITSGATLNGGVVVNEPGADVDFRVEGDTDANLLFVDASTDRVGFGTNTPTHKVQINGASPQLSISGTAGGGNRGLVLIDNNGTKYNFFVGAQNNVNNAFEITPSTVAGGTTFSTPALVVDSSGSLGVGTTGPNYQFHVTNNIAVGAAGFNQQLLLSNDSVQSQVLGVGYSTLKLNALGAGVLCGSTVSVGGATPAASGAGITFPATQSASSDVNTLDDYEEGDWTPTGNNITFSVAVGRYNKIGRQVTVWWQVEFPSTANGDAAAIGSLPFTVSSNSWSGALAITNVNIAGVLAFAHNGQTNIFHRNANNDNYANSDFSLKFSYGCATYIA